MFKWTIQYIQLCNFYLHSTVFDTKTNIYMYMFYNVLLTIRSTYWSASLLCLCLAWFLWGAYRGTSQLYQFHWPLNLPDLLLGTEGEKGRLDSQKVKYLKTIIPQPDINKLFFCLSSIKTIKPTLTIEA